MSLLAVIYILDITDSPSKSLHNHLSAKHSTSSHASESSSDNLAASPSSPHQQSKSQPLNPHQPSKTLSRTQDKKPSSHRSHRIPNSHSRIHTHHYQPHHHSQHQHHTLRKPASTKPKKMNGVLEKSAVPTTAELRDLFNNPGAAPSNGQKRLEPLETDLDSEDIESMDGSSASYTHTEVMPEYHQSDLQLDVLSLNPKPTLLMYTEKVVSCHKVEENKDSELDTLSLSEATPSPNEEEYSTLVASGESKEAPPLERLPSLPASLTDSAVPIVLDSYTETPEPPPEFTGDEEEEEAEEEVVESEEERDLQGVQGTSNHSSYMESILYILSISTDLLMQTNQSDYKDANQFLLQNIATPLQR